MAPSESQPVWTTWPDWLVCTILAREAEAVVRYDPVFPADPFAAP